MYTQRRLTCILFYIMPEDNDLTPKYVGRYKFMHDFEFCYVRVLV